MNKEYTLYLSFSIFFIFSQLFGCARPFETVDFKYSNLSHMPFTEALTSSNHTPLEVATLLEQWLVFNDEYILGSIKIDFSLEKTLHSQQCWKAMYKVHQLEFAAYQNNNYDQYKNINRNKIFNDFGVKVDCTFLRKEKEKNIEGYLLTAETNYKESIRTLTTTEMEKFIGFFNSNNFIILNPRKTHQTYSKDFKTRVEFYIWKKPNNKKTNIYIHARPVSNNIVSSAGASVGYIWWQESSGLAETELVKKYKTLIRYLDLQIPSKPQKQHQNLKHPVIVSQVH